MGALAEDLGHRQEARASYEEVLRLFEEVGSPNAEISRAALRRLGADA
jgi:hypothetical protein